MNEPGRHFGDGKYEHENESRAENVEAGQIDNCWDYQSALQMGVDAPESLQWKIFAAEPRLEARLS